MSPTSYDGQYFFSTDTFARRVHLAQAEITNKINSISKSDFASANYDDRKASLVETFSVDCPVLIENDVHTFDAQDVNVFLSTNTKMGLIRQRSCTLYRIAIPFTGDGKLFFAQPGRAHGERPFGGVVGQEVLLDCIMDAPTPTTLKNEMDRSLALLKEYLEHLSLDVSSWNALLQPFVSSVIAGRRNKFAADDRNIEALGYPLKRRSDPPEAYQITVRRKLAFRKMPSKAAPTSATHLLKEQSYQDILDCLRSMAKVMERSPAAFMKLKEEHLRFHLLIPLNQIFEGQATGETFNFIGKTDILIRHQDHNLFIAECKIWAGPESLTKALNQILKRYLTWRDTKAAVILFVRKHLITKVCSQVFKILQAHPSFLKILPSDHEGEHVVHMKSRRDSNITVTMTVMCFHVPPPPKTP